MGTWTEENGSHANAYVSVRAVYSDNATVVTVQVRDGDANDNVGTTVGSTVAAIVADALDATNEFHDLTTSRGYVQTDYATYAP
jgi:hypothetical protein